MNKTIIYLSCRLFLLILIPILIIGCAISNEGSTDYRYIKRPSTDDNNQGNARSDFSKVKYIKPADAVAKHIVQVGDPLVISLKQVFIKDFVEWRSPLRVVRAEPPNGEIAIVVNAFEVGSGNRMDFGPNGKKNARVVFFSDDVWEGQFLNLSNLSTIYGPLAYKGNPFILDVYIVEMDTPGPQLRQLLANLAAIGSTFYPPASPLVGPLAQLAGTLITDDQDDRAYHFTAEFKSPSGSDQDLNTGLLLTGDYVFIRERNRYTSTDWSKLSFDKETGKLIYKDCDNTKKDCYYRENSYVVVEVNTALSDIQNQVEQTVYQTFSELSNEISNNAAPIFKEFDAKSQDSLDRLAKQVREKRSADLIKRQLRVMLRSEKSRPEWNIALNNFVALWTETYPDNDTKKIRHDVSGKELIEIEELLVKILHNCGKNATSITEFMNILRDRENQIKNDINKYRGDLATGLSC